MRGELLIPKQNDEKRREYMRRWRAKHRGKKNLRERDGIMLNIGLRLGSKRKTTTGEIERESLSGKRNTMMREEAARPRENIIRGTEQAYWGIRSSTVFAFQKG